MRMRGFVLLVAAFLVSPTPAVASGPPSIWFELGSARLSAADQATMDYAATWLRSANAVRVYIDVSTDRVGSARSNRLLARRRGEAVKYALVRRGFRADRIAIRAHGETRPLVETADGVPERQNRYAMIFIETVAPNQ